ncbi:MAG: Xaa-Pro dipeptidase [Pseudomonadota bacterium]|nr:Xaa-Pro dipeptidase [Pseudomonadota bacterium]
MKLDLYRQHILKLSSLYARILQAQQYDAVVLFAGASEVYFAQDIAVPFRMLPHFARWCPLHSEGHVLLVDDTGAACLYIHQQQSIWVDSEEQDLSWQDCFKVIDQKAMLARIKSASSLAYIGKDAAWLPTAAAINPPELLAKLDFSRRVKTAYEIDCITTANATAARGHQRLRTCFAAGMSEFESHLQYLQAISHDVFELPYQNIVAGDEKSAILHYQHKRRDKCDFRLLLADCGANYLNYCADITRTYVRADVEPTFAALLSGLEVAQQKLCQQAIAGKNFYDLNFQAHEEIAALLKDTDVLRVNAEEAIATGLTKLFFPHGLGHMLGVQVHDVNGVNPAPAVAPQKPILEIFAKLRFREELAVDEVITIEPGIYFIPMLLAEHRQDQRLNWRLIDRLLPLGGMRIEDDVLVATDASVNITRKFLGNEPIVQVEQAGEVS